MSTKNIEDIYPLSPMQQGMLFHSLSAPESGTYVEHLVCTLCGELDVPVFERAWQEVVARHAILRTLFVWERGDKPLQVVRRSVNLSIEQHDWRNLSKLEQEERLEALLDEDKRRGFNLSEAPLMRLALMRVAANSHKFFWSHHHLILDGWSLPLVLRDVFDLYQAFHHGRDLQLKRGRSYREYISWLKGQDSSAAQRFWRKYLSGFNAPTPLPASRLARQPRLSPADALEQEFKFREAETRRLQAYARQQQLTLSTLVQGAWAILLSRYSKEEEVVYGATVSGRGAGVAGVEEMVGMFINTVAVRVRVAEEEAVGEWLGRMQERAVELVEYEHAPLWQVQQCSDVPRGIPLFESLIVFENYPIDASLFEQNDGLRMADVRSSEQTNYPLTVSAVVLDSQLRLQISYDRSRFDDETIRRILGHLHTLLLNLVEHPQRPLKTISLLTETERQQLLVQWNQTRTNYPREKCVHQLFEEQVERRREAVAVVDGDEEISYEELNRRANRVAHRLVGLGVGPEIRVGLCMERSWEIVVSLVGILKAGGVYVPLNPEYPRERLGYIIDNAHISVLLTQRHTASPLPPETNVRLISLDQDWSELKGEPETNPATTFIPDHLAYVIYTSGTTGQPKGVMVSHKSLCNHLSWMQSAFPLTAQDRLLQKYSLSFDVSLLEILYPLLAGASLIMTQPGSHLDYSYLIDLLLEQHVTALDLVPSMLDVLLEDERFRAAHTLRRVLCGGEVLTKELQEKFFNRAGAELHNLYGPTEATISATFWTCQPEYQHMSVPIGRPIANTEVYILDQQLEPVPIGVAGELYIGGECLARGYLDEPALTGGRFIPHLFSKKPGERLYRTGDAARYLPDGTIDFLGRTDHQVKIRGFRIELGEIEAALVQHPNVREAVVVACDGEGGSKRLCAYVVEAQRSTLSTSELYGFLKKKLPDYMIPATFMQLDEMPLTPHGKIDRRALPEHEHIRLSLSRAYVAPRTRLEADLAFIWTRVLGIEQVGIHDNFFELGGDSILSIQIVARAAKAGLRLKPGQLFEHQTIAELAAVVGTTEEVEIEQGTITGEVPLTPIQHWFFEQNLPDAHHYNQALMLEAQQALDPVLLERVFARLLEHHDALRLRFVRREGDWRQINEALEKHPVFSSVNLSGLSAAGQASAMLAKADELQSGLDLSQGPLVRAAFFDLGAGRPGHLLIIIHHLAVDAVSWRILLEDIQTGYRQLSEGQSVEFPPKSTSFKDWAQQLARYAQTQRLAQEELAYWLDQLNHTYGKLLVDNSEAESTEATARTIVVALNTEETGKLLHEASAAYHTQVIDLLLTALAQACAHWTTQSTLLIDLEGHGRESLDESLDLSRTVGWFTTIYPVRLELKEGEDEGSALKRVKEQVRGIPGKGIGYGVLRYMSGGEWVEGLREQARAGVSFNYLGQFDQASSESSLFKLADGPIGATRSLKGRRSHLLDIEGLIFGGQLRVEWTYSEEAHERAKIEQLASGFMAALRRLIAHCLSAGAGGFTPSDFPLVKFEQNTLDDLLKAAGKVDDIYPLSPMQQGMLFHSLSAPESGIYIEQLGCTLKGDLNTQAFAQAWQRVLDQHQVLRTGFAWEDLNEPVQLVHSHARLTLEQHDWSSIPYAEQQQRLESFLLADRERGFVLTRPPLMRLTLIKVASDVYECIWTSHHLLLDGWSVSLVLKETFDLYEALCRSELPELKRGRSYREYISWLKGQDSSAAQRFWRNYLSGFKAPTPLPASRLARQPRHSPADALEQEFKFREAETRRLQAYARQQQLTLSTLVQGAWAILLSRYSKEEEVVYGATVSGRGAGVAGVEEMVGMFINTVAVRVRVAEEEAVGEWLGRMQERAVELVEYEHAPLWQVQQCSDVPSGIPLFESLLVFENYPVAASLREQRGGLRISNVRAQETTNYPLTIIAIPGEELLLKASFHSNRFDDETIRRILGHLHTLLLNLVEHPQRPLKTISLLTETERQQLLVQWNQTRTNYPREKCVHQLFEEQVEWRREAVAVVDGDKEISYEELNRRANRVAHRLVGLGVGPETRVGIMLERSIEMIAGLLAILKAGGAYVPLNPNDPRERVDFILAETGVKAVLTDERGLGSLPEEYRDGVLSLDKETEAVVGHDEQNPCVQMSSDNLAYITYTSGSTGKPKGVSVVHRGVVRLVRQTNYASFGPSEIFLQLAPLAFDASTFEIWGSLLNGARLVLIPVRQPSLEELAQAIRQHQVTTLWLTAGLFHLMVDHHLEALRSVPQLLAGGDVLSVSHVEKFLAKSGGAKLINGYGPTENTTFTCCYTMTGPQDFVSSVPIGRPVSNTEVYILDQNMQPVGIGVTGELYTGGDGLARGYFNSPDLTAERFIPHPFSTEAGKRLYKSGDIARYLPDGNIEFIGRADRQVKVRGFRVEPGEIETVLGQHPSVRESVVVMREDTPGDQRLVAYLVARQEQLIDNGELRDYLKERVPEYMLPSVFVLLDEMPLTPQGKVDRNALPAPCQQRLESKAISVVPRDAIEAALAEIWAQVLGLERVGIHDNFFELGGHSLLATQVITRLHKVLQVELPIRAIFETPTIVDLAAKIRNVFKGGPSQPLAPIERVSREEHLPLSFAQQRLWFLDRLEPDSDFYNIPVAVRLTGHLNIAALQESFNESARRHETLRTHFKISGGEPEQIIAPAQRLELTLTDLSQLSTAEREARVKSLMTEEARRPFKLSTGPLFRVSLLRVGLDEHILLLTMHHIISDGWSMSIFIREMATLYEAFLRGQPPPLPELEIQYADYAVWQQSSFNDGALQDQLDYWKQQLGDGPAILHLPTVGPRPKIQTFRGASRSVMVSVELTNALKELSRRESVTLFMLLLAAFKVLLHRYSGQSDIAVGTPVANRTRTEIEGLIGFFVNTLVLRTNVSSEESFEELLKHVREVCLEAYAHQELPFEKLVEELQPARDLSRTPLFQVMFAFQNRPVSSLALSGLSASALEVNSETSKFDLSLFMEETEQGLSASLEYNTDLFDEPTIARTLVHFETLLQGIVADPSQSLSNLAHSLPYGGLRVDERTLHAPALATADRTKTFIAPRNPLEEQLAKIWSDVLGVEQVGVADNFFDLGGHSLSATRLLALAQETFKVELPLRLFFESATVEWMARAMIAHEERPGQTEKIARLLKRLEAMSAEEVGRALKK